MPPKAFPCLLASSQVGDLELPNSIVMSPMTRFRVAENGVPSPLNATYYSQRASAGLIISETVYVEPRGRLAPRTAGLYTDEQVAAWQRVTEEVHAKGGRIFAQLCHAGRVTHDLLMPDNCQPIAPSAIAKVGEVRIEESLGRVAKVPAPIPRALETTEIKGVIDEFRQAGQRAVRAGFDGVELHSSSGFLHQQFLSTTSNSRTDKYGGSVANRRRFVLETVEALSEVRGSGRVGIKIGPNFAYHGMDMGGQEMLDTYAYLSKALSPLQLGYVHVQYPPWGLFIGAKDFNPIDFVRGHYSGTLIGAGELDRHSAEDMLASKRCDLAAFGRRFIANPDLPARIASGLQENVWDEQTLYTPTPKGFIDYPSVG